MVYYHLSSSLLLIFLKNGCHFFSPSSISSSLLFFIIKSPCCTSLFWFSFLLECCVSCFFYVVKRHTKTSFFVSSLSRQVVENCCIFSSLTLSPCNLSRSCFFNNLVKISLLKNRPFPLSFFYFFSPGETFSLLLF